MKKTAVQHLVAIGIFLLLTFIYCYPAMQGNKLVAGDTIHWMGMSEEARAWYEKTGENPMWSNSMFGGMPTVTHYMRGNTNLVYPIQEALTNLLPSPTYFLLIAMICFYIFMMSWKVNRWLAIFGAVAFAFASYNLQIIVAGHNTKMFSIAYMPLVLAGMHWIYRQRYLAGAAAALIGLSLMISNSMYQIDYYLFIIMLGFGIGYLVEAIRNKTWKEFFISTAIMIGVGILSIGPSADQLMLTQEYAKVTMRGGQSELTLDKKEKKADGGLDKDYAFQWSQSLGETFTLFVPNLYGGGGGEKLGENSNYYKALKEIGASDEQAEESAGNAPTYWGPQPFLSGPVYFGVIIMLLFILGLFIIPSRFKWVLAGVGFAGIMMAWGRHFGAFNYFLFDHLPMYNKFRTPSMAMVIPGLMFCILGIWALQEFFSEKLDMKARFDALKKSFIITAGIVVLFGFGGSMFLSFKGENDDKLKSQLVRMVGNEQAGTKLFTALVDDRAGLTMKDGLRSLVYILLAAGLLWMFIKNKVDRQKAMLGVGLLICIDLLSIGMRYIKEDDYRDADEFEAQFQPRMIDMQIKKDPDPYYRVFDLTADPFNDAMGAFHHKMIGGYHPAKMEAYQDLIDQQLQGGGKMNAEVLNMLNTKYILFNGRDGKPTAQPNPGATGNAWFVPAVKVVANANEEMLSLNAENIGDTAKVENPFRARQVAVVQQKHWKENTSSYVVDSTAKIQLTKYGLNGLSFTSSNANNGFAVFSDIYYPYGWNAYIDGKEVPIVKTNYLLRGLAIPAGNHAIEFKFQPQTYLKWNKVSMISSILVLLVLLGAIGMGVRNELRKKDADVAHP